MHCYSNISLLPPRPLQPFPRGAEFGFEAFEFGEGELVFAGHDFIWQRVERVAGEGGVGGGAEDDDDGRVFAGVRPVFAGVAEVEVHLAGVGVGEGAELEVEDDEAAQAAVEEDEVHAIAAPPMRRRRWRPTKAKSPPSSSRKASR